MTVWISGPKTISHNLPNGQLFLLFKNHSILKAKWIAALTPPSPPSTGAPPPGWGLWLTMRGWWRLIMWSWRSRWGCWRVVWLAASSARHYQPGNRRRWTPWASAWWTRFSSGKLINKIIKNWTNKKKLFFYFLAQHLFLVLFCVFS